jgi:hypothetical protein
LPGSLRSRLSGFRLRAIGRDERGRKLNETKEKTND